MKSRMFIVLAIMNAEQLSGGQEAGQEAGETATTKCHAAIGQPEPMLTGYPVLWWVRTPATDWGTD